MLGGAVPRPYCWHIKRRHQLLQGFAKRVDNTENGGTLGREDGRRCGCPYRGARRGNGEGDERAAGGGGVVVTVALVEPDFVPGPHAQHVLVNVARFRVQDHILGRRGMCIPVRIPSPSTALRVEDRIAADQQILMRAESEAGWPAKVHWIRRLHLASDRDA